MSEVVLNLSSVLIFADEIQVHYSRGFAVCQRVVLPYMSGGGFLRCVRNRVQPARQGLRGAAFFLDLLVTVVVWLAVLDKLAA